MKIHWQPVQQACLWSQVHLKDQKQFQQDSLIITYYMLRSLAWTSDQSIIGLTHLGLSNSWCMNQEPEMGSPWAKVTNFFLGSFQLVACIHFGKEWLANFNIYKRSARNQPFFGKKKKKNPFKTEWFWPELARIFRSCLCHHLWQYTTIYWHF